MTKTDWVDITAHISEASGQAFEVNNLSTVGGGCINQAWRLQGNSGTWFVKINSSARRDMFAAEMAALQAIAATDTITVPVPLCCGATAQHAYLVLEYLDLDASGGDASAVLGEQLAAMHRHTANHFGWYRNNTIGSTAQINTQTADWVTFWRDRRLGLQLELAARNGYRGRLQQRGEKLLGCVDQLLAGHEPLPSLLHGDLWSGNHSAMADGRPVIFDPASYYGDRETDLAMTELFGGFSGRFYRAYRDAWPLADGYARRKVLYNLYHILNHLNLFGAGYRSQAETMVEQLLAELG